MITTTAAVGNTDRNHQRSGGYYVGRDYCRAETRDNRLSCHAHCHCEGPASMEELLFDELKFQAGKILPVVTLSNDEKP